MSTSNLRSSAGRSAAAFSIVSPTASAARQLGIVALLIILAARADAQLFTYSFGDVSSGSSSSSAGGTSGNLTFSTFTTSGVGTAANAGGVFSFTGWTNGATDGSNIFSGGLDLTDYYQFSITPAAGFQYSLTGLTFDAGRSGGGPRQFVIRSDADNYSSNLTAGVTHANMSVVGNNTFQFTDNTATTAYPGSSITLSGGEFTNTTGERTFRIYAFNAEGATGSFRVDNFSIAGSVSAIPEPSTYAAIAGAAAAGAALWRRRRVEPRKQAAQERQR